MFFTSAGSKTFLLIRAVAHVFENNSEIKKLIYTFNLKDFNKKNLEIHETVK